MLHPHKQMRRIASLLLAQAAECAKEYEVLKMAKESQLKLYHKWAKDGLGIADVRIADRLLELNKMYGSSCVVLNGEVHKILNEFIDIVEYYDIQWHMDCLI